MLGTRQICILALLVSCPLIYQEPSVPSADQIVQRSAEATHSDWEKAPGFDYCDTEVAGSHTRTFAELMIAGSTYERLVAIDGAPLPEQEEQQQAARFATAVEQRNHETEAQRAKRVAQYEKERHRDQMLLVEMTKGMIFQLDGTAVVAGHQTFVLRATPRPGYVPKGMETQVLTGMRGTLWVDQESYRWVKVEAEVMHPVNIAGFVARVEPGTRFLLEESPVAPEVWMATRFTMRAKAKILFFFPASSSSDDTWFNYTPAGHLKPQECLSQKLSAPSEQGFF